ncbi:MAG TPA: hypothetical protein ENH07_04550 [Nitrospirae bacterium]|nr:hypothetical protein BMS3Abin08_02457 [bacterium BMS3Abin08]HDO35547.1 hypothetical protein [Nitrospirota bacterium]
MAEKDFLKEIGALKKEIAALREKSEVLTDRAEDIFIPGLVSEEICSVESADDATRIALGNMSVPKGISCSACENLEGNSLRIIMSAPRNSPPATGEPFFLSKIHLLRVSEKTTVLLNFRKLLQSPSLSHRGLRNPGRTPFI